MTNRTPPDNDAALPPELRALAPVGGRRRPVKVVPLPAFRAARARLDALFLALRLPVVALNGAADRRACVDHHLMHEAA